ncbi:MAG: cytochrome c biogenesis CcdA family protein [Thermoplasmatota archaeon]
MPGLTAVTAFLAGVLSFFGPCVLPIVPGFLAFIAERGHASQSRARRLGTTAAFVAGFGIAFTVLGAIIGAAGSTLMYRDTQVWLRRIGGVIIIAFGFAMLGLWRMPWMDRDFRVHEVGHTGPLVGSLLMGAAFGVGWTPCVGPILAAILLTAGIGGSAASGATLLAIYSLGLAVPFMVLGALADYGAAFVHRYRKATQVVEVVGGLLVVALGIVVFTGAANRLLLLWGS